jgi:hypothetical protein
MEATPPRRFLPAILLAIAVNLAAPFMGLIRNFLFDAFPRTAVRGMTAALGLVAAGFFLYALAKIRHHRLLRYGGLVVVGALLWIQAIGFKTQLASVNVVEKVHIFEYGLLAYLLYRAFRPAGDLSAPLLALLWTVFAGTIEEGVQWWVETRTGEIRDVLLNAFSGLCGLVFALSLEPPERFSWRISPAGWRRLGTSAAILTLTMGVFFYAAHLGYMVEDPEIGRFRSFFTREQLEEAAADRAEKWAANPPGELSPWRKEDRYLLEAGWHNQHRNQSYELRFYYLARQANLILEKYHAPYLDLESFRKTGDRRFPPHVLRELDAKAPRRPPEEYVSPVGDRLIYTRPSKPAFLAILLPVVLFLWALPRLALREGL